MLYITGDCHRNYRRFNIENFPEQKEMTKEDFVLICGDFGIWDNSKEEQWWLKWLSQRNFTILFVDGNHENFDLLKQFPVVDFHGGKAHKIRDNIYHLMRGEVFNLCGKNVFTFGGARSHDIEDGILDPSEYKDWKLIMKKWDREGKRYRIKGITWWEQELPSVEELEHGIQTLERNSFKVDYIVSHCCPQKIADSYLTENYGKDILTSYFDEIMDRTDFKHWFFGHYHGNRSLEGKFHLLYEQIIKVIG